jgi:hypothetical protein
MDRFALQFSLGYVAPDEEVAVLTDQIKTHPIEEIVPCVTRAVHCGPGYRYSILPGGQIGGESQGVTLADEDCEGDGPL